MEWKKEIKKEREKRLKKEGPLEQWREGVTSENIMCKVQRRNWQCPQ